MEENKKRNTYAVISEFYPGEHCEVREEFEKSLFRNVYRSAYKDIQEKVFRQIENKDKVLSLEENQSSDNIITFIGRRGTGKSTVMKSFMRGLRENIKSDISDFTVYADRMNNRKVKFIALDWIDASLLEKEEDIFDVILAKMLNKLLKKQENQNSFGSYQEQDMYNQFASVYKKHLNLKSNKNLDLYSEDMAIANLRNLARSSDLRNEFQQLVDNFIKLNFDGSYEGENTFLVVAIDDLDMNIESGFEILEKIQRYLRIERLIVLMAVNQTQMKLCCEKHFEKVFENRIGYTDVQRRENVSDLADQYMKKALPTYSRIYMPSLKKMDYDRDRVTKIMIEESEQKELSIKMAFFTIAWTKNRVRYDVLGKKRHFMEPETLRELNNNVLIRKYMDSLNGLESDKEMFLTKLNMNYRRSMDDLLFRYASETLQDRERSFFIALSEMDIRRRGQYIVERFNIESEKMRYQDGEYYRSIQRNLKIGYRYFKYSYGELLHSLYCAGRIEIYDKKLIHAIFAMYTLTLAKIFYRFKAEISKDENLAENKNYMMLKELFGDSVAGSWSWKIMPKLKTENKNEYYTGAAKNVVLSNDLFKISKENYIKYSKLSLEEIEMSETYIANRVKELEWQFILWMFLIAKQEYQFKVDLQGEVGSKIAGNGLKNDDSYYIKVKNAKFDYNVMGFVNNVFAYEEKLEEFIALLYDMMGEITKKEKLVQSVKEGLVQSVKEVLFEEENGFFADMKKWYEECAGMVLPVYSIDIYYNIFKRLVRKQKIEKQEYIQKQDLYNCFVELLDEWEIMLHDNDEKYRENNAKEIEEFEKNFSECPLIQKIRLADEEQKEEYCEFVNLIITDTNNTEKEENEKFIDWLAM